MTTATFDPQAVKSLVADAIDDGTYAVKRAVKSIKRGVEQAEDARDEAVHWIKRQPLKAVTIAAGAGLVLGLTTGLAISGCARRTTSHT